MSEFLTYDQKYATSPTGLANTGVICYFNSLLQCMLSCTSLNKLITTDKDVRNRNTLTKKYAEMVEANLNGGKDLSSWSPIIWNEFMSVLTSKNRKDKLRFGSGQEDSSEGLLLMLEMFDDPKVDRLFEHRFQSNIMCGHCGKRVSEKNDEGMTVEMHYDEVKNYTVQNFLLNHKPAIDDDYKCPKCGIKGKKSQIRKLVMVPEVIIIQFKKYDQKWGAEFPVQLEIPSQGGKLVYKCVAQTEHAGGQSGGHYWARALRRDGVYVLNDTNVAPGQWSPTQDTYMVWYHIC